MDNYQDVLHQMEQFGIELRQRDLSLMHERIRGGRKTTCGKGGKDWYKLHLWQPDAGGTYVVGSFGTYRHGGDWQKVEIDLAPLSEAERARQAAHRKALAEAAALERAQEIANAAAEAIDIWRKGVRAATTPYLDRKQVQGEAFRALDRPLSLRWPSRKRGEDDVVVRLPVGTTLLPLVRPDLPRDQALRGLQFIKPEGMKIYLRSFDKPGCCIRLGEIDAGSTALLMVVEGYATGLTARMAVDHQHPVYVALDAGNLAEVVRVLRGLYPATRILILADDDYMTRDKRTGALINPGRTAASRAAKATDGCDLVWPIFKASTRGPKDTDFNDLHVLEGLDVVRRQLVGVVEAMARRYG